MIETCGALGFWGHRNTPFRCELAKGHDVTEEGKPGTGWAYRHESDDVVWFGDHTPPCSCGRCPVHDDEENQA